VRKVQRAELVDYATWADDMRGRIQTEVFTAKKERRVLVPPALTFLFENALTVRWQVQEMMRVERIVKETAIQHELAVYNGLLGGDGALGFVLLIEIPDEEERRNKLAAWRGLEAHIYAELADGTRIRAQFDPMQVSEEKLSAVQYMTFDTGGQVPVAVGSDHTEARGRSTLSDETRAALASDLAT